MNQAEVDKLQEDYAAMVKANQQVARLNADLQEQVVALTDCLRPFYEAYTLHEDDAPLSKRKVNMSLNVRIEDWERVADVMSALEEGK